MECQSGSIFISEKRIEKAKEIIRKALDHCLISARYLPGILGSIISMSAVVGRLTRRSNDRTMSDYHRCFGNLG